MPYNTLLLETYDRVAVIRLNRPKALNALNSEMVGELSLVLDALDQDTSIGAIVLTGSDKAFAAGADIREMSTFNFADVFGAKYLTVHDRLAKTRKPVIAAVSGFALGGGCELAMMADFIIASETAKFGQPEITLGIIPGIGGTQRLARAVGKAKAMDMILTGRMIDAVEAERIGLVARITPADKYLDEAIAAAAKMAGYSLPAVLMAKEAVNTAFETTLAGGVHFERSLFYSCFALEDQKEGMNAFLEKRPAAFQNK